MDTYRTFAELQQFETEFTIYVRQGCSGVAVIAPHGGGIEPGTLELANAIAGTEHAFYGFEGRKSRKNSDLHITSCRFDEPCCVKLVQQSQVVLSVHGCDGDHAKTYIGGLAYDIQEQIAWYLHTGDFATSIPPSTHLQGRLPSNICNRGRLRQGVQLELTAGLRRQMFAGGLRTQRQHTTPLFHQFVALVRAALVGRCG